MSSLLAAAKASDVEKIKQILKTSTVNVNEANYVRLLLLSV